MFKAIGWQTASAVYVGLASTLLVFGLGRLLGPQGFGEYSVVLAVAAILGIFIDGGFRNLIQREHAEPTRHLAVATHSLMPAAVGHASLMTVGLVFAILLLPITFDSSLALAVAVTGAMALVQFRSASLRGNGDFAGDARWQAIQRTLTAVAAILAAAAWHRAGPAFAGWFLGAWLALLISPARRMFSVVSLPHLRLTAWWRICAPFLIIDIATAVYFRIDVVMLDWLTGNTTVAGIYSAAYRLLEVVVFFFNPVAVVLFRRLRLTTRDRPAFRKLLLQTAGAGVVLGGLIWGGTLWCASDIVRIAFGPDFNRAASLLPWLMPAVLFLLPNAILTQGAIASNLEWPYAFSALVAAAANVLLNAWLIPLRGAYGAAIATVATEAILFVGMSWSMRKWLTRE